MDQITLDQALELAREHNARLPVAALDARMAEQDRAEAASRRKIRLGVEGNLSIAPRGGYDPAASNLGEDRLQMVLERPLYDGGKLAAEERRAGALAGAARERFRRAESEVELDVRTRYAELLAARHEAAVREDGLQAAPLLPGVARKPGRIGPAGRKRPAPRAPAGRDRGRGTPGGSRARRPRPRGARHLMGRTPTRRSSSPRFRLPPSRPSPADAAEARTAEIQAPDASASAQAELLIPDVASAQREVDAARAGLDATLAERRPTVSLRADAGLWGTDTTRLVPPDLRASDPGAGAFDRLDRDLGASVSLGLTWSLFDSGGRRARTARARLALERAKQQVVAEQTDAQRALTRARDARTRAATRLQILRDARPQARDAYLDATSRYLGGAASYLDVIDAFDATISVGVDEAQATLDYRIAEAEMIRWGGTP